MENKSKKRILIGILVVLILINLTALGSFGYHKFFGHHTDDRNWNKEDKFDRNPHDRVKYFVKKELNLNDDQFDKYCKLKDVNTSNSDSIWHRLSKLKERTHLEITKTDPDSIKLLQLSDSIGFFHMKMQMEMNRHFLEVKKILNSDQIVKYNQMILNIDTRQNRNHDRSGRKTDTCNNPRKEKK